MATRCRIADKNDFVVYFGMLIACSILAISGHRLMPDLSFGKITLTVRFHITL